MPIEQCTVSEFRRVVLRDGGTLDITLAAEEALSVEAEAETLPKVRAQVQDGALTLRLARDWRERATLLRGKRPEPRIHYRLKVKRLSGLVIADQGRANVGEMRSPQLELKIDGSGKIDCKMLTVGCLGIALAGQGDVICQARHAVCCP